MSIKSTKIHASADVQTDKIGDGTFIWQFCVVLPGAKIGCDCNINAHCFVENEVVVGDRVTVKSGVQLWDGIVLENDVFVGPNATFTNDRTPRSKQPFLMQKTVVQQGSTIGANATILPGVTIGRGAFVAAGAVVTKDVQPGRMVRGGSSC